MPPGGKLVSDARIKKKIVLFIDQKHGLWADGHQAYNRSE